MQYATSDGTATSGSDYTATVGDAHLRPVNETSKTVSVPVLDDIHNDSDETVTLTLSNPTPSAYVRLGDATATGTIENSDPLQRAWLSRFGRTVGTHVTDAIGDRLRAGTGGQHSHLTVGGFRMPLGRHPAGQRRAPDGSAPAPNTLSPGGRGAGEGDASARPLAPDANAEPPGRLASVVTEVARVLGLGAAAPDTDGPGVGSSWPDARPDLRLRQRQTLTPQVNLRQLLMGSSFRLNLGATDPGAGTPQLTAWGRVANTQFNGQDDTLSLDGDVVTGTVGVDGTWDRLLAGVAVSHSRGDGTYSGAGDRGDLEQTMTSLHPYLRYAMTDRLDVWGLLGYGWGQLDLERDVGETLETDTNMVMGALGGRGILLAPAETGGSNWPRARMPCSPGPPRTRWRGWWPGTATPTGCGWSWKGRGRSRGRTDGACGRRWNWGCGMTGGRGDRVRPGSGGPDVVRGPRVGPDRGRRGAGPAGA